MKITKSQLKQIIQEELEYILQEQNGDSRVNPPPRPDLPGAPDVDWGGAVDYANPQWDTETDLPGGPEPQWVTEDPQDSGRVPVGATDLRLPMRSAVSDYLAADAGEVIETLPSSMYYLEGEEPWDMHRIVTEPPGKLADINSLYARRGPDGKFLYSDEELAKVATFEEDPLTGQLEWVPGPGWDQFEAATEDGSVELKQLFVREIYRRAVLKQNQEQRATEAPWQNIPVGVFQESLTQPIKKIIKVE